MRTGCQVVTLYSFLEVWGIKTRLLLSRPGQSPGRWDQCESESKKPTFSFLKNCGNISVQFSCSVLSNSVASWTAARQASLSITNSRSLLKLMSTELVMPSNHLILCCPLLLPPSIFPSIREFPNESVLHIRWPEYWGFSFSISPFNEYSGLISFRIDWFDLLAVQGTLKSLLQYHSVKASILRCLVFSGPTLTSMHNYWKSHSFDHIFLLAK